MNERAFDLVIRGGRVVDGTGRPSFAGRRRDPRRAHRHRRGAARRGRHRRRGRRRGPARHPRVRRHPHPLRPHRDRRPGGREQADAGRHDRRDRELRVLAVPDRRRAPARPHRADGDARTDAARRGMAGPRHLRRRPARRTAGDQHRPARRATARSASASSGRAAVRCRTTKLAMAGRRARGGARAGCVRACRPVSPTSPRCTRPPPS